MNPLCSAATSYLAKQQKHFWQKHGSAAQLSDTKHGQKYSSVYLLLISYNIAKTSCLKKVYLPPPSPVVANYWWSSVVMRYYIQLRHTLTLDCAMGIDPLLEFMAKPPVFLLFCPFLHEIRCCQYIFSFSFSVLLGLTGIGLLVRSELCYHVGSCRLFSHVSLLWRDNIFGLVRTLILTFSTKPRFLFFPKFIIFSWWTILYLYGTTWFKERFYTKLEECSNSCGRHFLRIAIFSCCFTAFLLCRALADT